MSRLQGGILRITLLEDDADQAKVMQVWLQAAGHHCRVCSTGKAFMAALQEDPSDILVMDWLLPDIGGDQVLQWVRENIDWRIPVIFVTQRDSEEDIVKILEMGADDYMVKPVKPLEMLARITALSRRANLDESNQALEYGNYRIDCEHRKVWQLDEEIELTNKEYELTLYLFKNAGRLLSRGDILENVWGKSAKLNTRTVDTHISRIRNKLSLVPENGWRLVGIYHHGYRLERQDPAEASAS